MPLPFRLLMVAWVRGVLAGLILVVLTWPAGAGHTVPCPHRDDVTACRCLESLRAAGVGEGTYENADGTTRTVAVRVSEVPAQDRESRGADTEPLSR